MGTKQQVCVRWISLPSSLLDGESYKSHRRCDRSMTSAILLQTVHCNAYERVGRDDSSPTHPLHLLVLPFLDSVHARAQVGDGLLPLFLCDGFGCHHRPYRCCCCCWQDSSVVSHTFCFVRRNSLSPSSLSSLSHPSTYLTCCAFPGSYVGWCLSKRVRIRTEDPLDEVEASIRRRRRLAETGKLTCWAS